MVNFLSRVKFAQINFSGDRTKIMAVRERYNSKRGQTRSFLEPSFVRQKIFRRARSGYVMFKTGGQWAVETYRFYSRRTTVRSGRTSSTKAPPAVATWIARSISSASSEMAKSEN